MLNWSYILALILPAYVIQVLFHEGAHALFARIQGQRILEFRPWPGIDKKGRFYFARVRFQPDATLVLNGPQRALRAWAPFLAGLPPFAALSATAGLWGNLSNTVAVNVLAVYWTALGVDLVRGLAWAALRPRRIYLDLNKGAVALGIPARWTSLLGGGLALILTAAWGWSIWPLIARSFG